MKIAMWLILMTYSCRIQVSVCCRWSKSLL